jgi:hypothetical protein
MRPRRAQRFCKNLHSTRLLMESIGVFQRCKAPSTATRSRPHLFPTQQERPPHPIPPQVLTRRGPALPRHVEAVGGQRRQCWGIRHQLVEGKLWSTRKRRRSLAIKQIATGSATHSRHRRCFAARRMAEDYLRSYKRLLEGRSRGAVTGSCSARSGAVNSHRGAVGPTKGGFHVWRKRGVQGLGWWSDQKRPHTVGGDESTPE